MMQRNLVRGGQHNIGHICTRQVCEDGLGDGLAMRWVGAKGETRDHSFLDLERGSNRVANALASLGLRPGDTLFTFLPKRPEQFLAFLGALKLRLVTGTLFSNFGDDALRDRLGPSHARAIVTQRSLLHKVERARRDLPELRYVLVVDGADGYPDVLDMAALVDGAADAFTAERTDATLPSVLHYTSGSTGKPKGALHVHGSVVLQHRTTLDVLGLREGDLFWCTADQGWVTGTSYGIIGPWSAGASQLHFGGAYDAHRWMALLQDQGVTVWYTAPTALRMLMREPMKTFQDPRPHLRAVFSVGEPLNPEVVHWGRKALRLDIHDTWFQTETGAILIANRPGVPVRPGSMGKAVEGVEPRIVDEEGRAVATGNTGNLCLTPGWPSMFRDYVGNRAAYESRFRAGLYWTGDLARKDEDGYFWFIGRSDDVINTAGHLVSPFEVESALLARPEVVEAAVVALPDDVLFEQVAAAVVLRPGVEAGSRLELELKLHVGNRVSTMASPRTILFLDALPKTRSGKIMRRVVKARLLGQDPGDLSAMDDEVAPAPAGPGGRS